MLAFFLKLQSLGFLKEIQIKEHTSFICSKTSLHPNLLGFLTDSSAFKKVFSEIQMNFYHTMLQDRYFKVLGLQAIRCILGETSLVHTGSSLHSWSAFGI